MPTMDSTNRDDLLSCSSRCGPGQHAVVFSCVYVSEIPCVGELSLGSCAGGLRLDSRGDILE